MALQAKLFRFKIELSLTDQGIYQSLDLRVAQHPSESSVYMLTRVFAYALSYEEGIEFSTGGLSDPETPSIRVPTNHGDTKVWIEIGNPATKKLHKASKASSLVKVYTYKDPQVLINEMLSETIHRKNEIEIYSISSKFLENFSSHIKKDNKWNLMLIDESLMISSDEFSDQTELKRHYLETSRSS